MIKVEIRDSFTDPLADISFGARITTNTVNLDKLATREQFVKGLVDLEHNTTIEQACLHMHISGISRWCCDQLRTYRHLSFLMQSQRRVDISEAEFIHPLSVQKTTDACYDIEKTMREFYTRLVKAGVPKGDARYYISGGFTTECVFTCNFWSLRHIIIQRLGKTAQWEIKALAQEMAKAIIERGWGWLISDKVNLESLTLKNEN